MRIAGILLISLTPVIFGLEYSYQLKNKRNFLSVFVKFIIFVKEQIRFSGREREEIFLLALREPEFATPFYESLYNCVKNGGNLEKIFNDNIGIRLKKQDISLICSFISGIGQNDVAGQMTHCDYYKEQTDKLLKQSETAYSVQSRLAIGLSLSAAATLFILLI